MMEDRFDIYKVFFLPINFEHHKHEQKIQTFHIPNMHGCSLQFSPFDGNLLAVVTCQPYGSSGDGILYLLELLDDCPVECICEFKWTDSLFDLAWSAYYEGIVATASGDGSLQIWNISHPERGHLLHLKEHKSEAYSVDWSPSWSSQQILSAGWDGLIKLWDPSRTDSVSTFSMENDLDSVYSCRFAPFISNFFSSVSISGDLKLWNSLDFSGKPTASVRAHCGEALTTDWSNFHPYLLATGGSDKIVRGWDIRYLKDSVYEYQGSTEAVRRIKFSTFDSNIIASTGYDYTTRIRNLMEDSDEAVIINSRSEVVNDVSWNFKKKNQLADCGWDSFVNVLLLDSSENT